MANRDWVFTQLAGSSPKVFTLSGYAAPFGRPRQRPVVEPSKELRSKRFYYPGSSIPTTHLFGTKQDDIELSGRWMDRMLGTGSAESNVRLMNEMIEDQRPVRIQWGDLLSYNGWITKLIPRWESLNECAWTLHLAIDSDNFEGKKVNVTDNSSLALSFVDDATAWLTTGMGQLPTTLPSLDAITGEIFDALDDMIANVTQFGAVAISITNSISNIETATFNELERLRAGLHQFKTAVLTLRDTVDSLSIDALLLDRQIEDDLEWLSFKSTSAVQTSNVLKSISVLDKAAERSEASRVKTTLRAKPGDSWESLAMAQYGDPDRAVDIRTVNGIKGGELPLTGRLYTIPR